MIKPPLRIFFLCLLGMGGFAEIGAQENPETQIRIPSVRLGERKASKYLLSLPSTYPLKTYRGNGGVGIMTYSQLPEHWPRIPLQILEFHETYRGQITKVGSDVILPKLISKPNFDEVFPVMAFKLVGSLKSLRFYRYPDSAEWVNLLLPESSLKHLRGQQGSLPPAETWVHLPKDSVSLKGFFSPVLARPIFFANPAEVGRAVQLYSLRNYDASGQLVFISAGVWRGRKSKDPVAVGNGFDLLKREHLVLQHQLFERSDSNLLDLYHCSQLTYRLSVTESGLSPRESSTP